MDTQPYKIWPEVPVMFSACGADFRCQLKHRIRRALEKLDDYGNSCGDPQEAAEMILAKILDIPDIARWVV